MRIIFLYEDRFVNQLSIWVSIKFKISRRNCHGRCNERHFFKLIEKICFQRQILLYRIYLKDEWSIHISWKSSRHLYNLTVFSVQLFSHHGEQVGVSYVSSFANRIYEGITCSKWYHFCVDCFYYKTNERFSLFSERFQLYCGCRQVRREILCQISYKFITEDTELITTHLYGAACFYIPHQCSRMFIKQIEFLKRL